MNKLVVLRAALAAAAIAGVVTISACSAGQSGAPETSNLTAATNNPAPAPASVASPATTQKEAPVPPQPTAQPVGKPAVAAKSSPVASAHIYWPTCGYPNYTKSAIKPADLGFSCDSSFELANATWTTWNSSDAQGAGVLQANDCTPSCANGTVHSQQVKVTFDKPVRLSCGEFWTEAKFTYSNGKTESREAVSGAASTESMICGSGNE